MFRIAVDSFTLLRHMAVMVACSLSYYNTNSYPNVIICLCIVFNSTWAATLATLCVFFFSPFRHDARPWTRVKAATQATALFLFRKVASLIA